MKRGIYLFMLIISLLICSCSSQKRLAREFTKLSKDAVIAFYVPDSLVKIKMRSDFSKESADSCKKIINVLNDNIFLDILFFSFESAVKDYGLSIDYWEDGTKKSDSLHWIVSIPKIELTEFFGYHDAIFYRQDSGRYFQKMPVSEVNVASWFELSNGLTDELLFTEQNIIDHIDRNYNYDANDVISYSVDTLNIKDFYSFAAFLGKLYAGYCYDYFMNDYINKNIKSLELQQNHSESYYYRFDPYESYYYITEDDKMIIVK